MNDSNTPHAPESKLNRISAYIIAGLAFLLPVFFIPSAILPFQFSKVAVVIIGVVAVAILFSVNTLRKGSVSFLWSRLILALCILPLAYFGSAILSAVPSLSLFGYQLDQDTFGFIALASMLSVATVLAIRTEKNIFTALLGLLFAGWAVLVFQTIQILFKAPLLPSLFTSPIVNTVGGWSDLALFVALIGSLLLLSMEALVLTPIILGVLSVTVAVALFILAVANVPFAWILIGAVAFAVLLLSFMRRSAGTSPMLGAGGIGSLLTLTLAIFFVFFGSGLSTSLQTTFNIQSFEVRPSVQATLGVLSQVYEKDAIFGSGPNTFAENWLLSRPTEIVATPFWNAEFNAGFGYIPTALVTGGIVVGLAWLLLIALFLFTAVRALLTVSVHGDRSYFLIAATSLGSLFLLVAHLFAVPSQSLTLLLFIFLGLFIASLRGTQFARPVSIVFSESPRLGFLSVLIVAVALVLSFVSLYGAGKVYASAVNEGQGILKSNAGDNAGATAELIAAATLSPQDRYYRALANLALGRLSVIVQKEGTDKKTQDEFQAGLSDAITAAQSAVNANSKNFNNWMILAAVYEAVVPLNISGAYEKAIETLAEAGKLNPGTPEVDYRLANLKAFKKDFEGARTSALAAVAKKADYTPAILFLAQLSLNEGKIDDAITAVRAAIVFNPRDASLLYQLGLLHLEAKQYADAAASFDAALSITPDFANASFFLGQANVFLGRNDEALAIFRMLNEKNPDNTVLGSVIDAIEKGTNPFTQGTVAPEEKALGI